MSEKLYVKNPLFPMAGIAVSVFTFAFGLAMAKSPGVFFFLGGMWLLLALFGYLRPCLAVLPAAALLCGIFCALTYAISRDTAQTSAAAARMLALSVETRGFTTEAAPYTVYRPVYLQGKDGAFAALSALCAMGAVLL